MNKSNRTKLKLSSETVRALSSEVLAGVGGAMMSSPSGGPTCPCVTSERCATQYPFCSNLQCA